MGPALVTLLLAWLGVNVLTVVAGTRIARLRAVHGSASVPAERTSLEQPRATPTNDGYASLVLTRLVVHARRVLGVDQAILLVREQRQPNRLIVVGAHGTEEDLVGRAIPIRGVLKRLVSDRPLRHGPLEEIVPDAGTATAITATAPVASGELAVLCAASADCERGFTRRELEILGELAATCASAVSDAGLGARLEPTMQVLVGGLSSAPEAGDLPRPIDMPSLAAQVGTTLGLDQPALAELDMAARACEITALRLNTMDDELARRRFRRSPPTHIVERLVDVPGLEAVAIIVRFLAERWDGEGRPHGLSREQIPLASRILAACLALEEAMADSSNSSALRRLKAQSGGAFDPMVIDAVAHVLTHSAEPLDAEDWALADAQFGSPLLAAVA